MEQAAGLERAAGWGDLLRGRALMQLVLITFGIGCHAFNEFAISAAPPLALTEIGGLRLINWVYGLYSSARWPAGWPARRWGGASARGGR